MRKLFRNTEEGIQEMFEYFCRILNEKGLDNYKTSIDEPSTIFLAGSPGAGKSEFIESRIDCNKYIIIDIDKYRNLFEGYNGINSGEFQISSTKVANKMYKFCMQNNLNVVVDGTFGNIKKIEENIGQCLKRKRDFSIILIFQDPVISYFYTKEREKNGKRNVPQEVFIDKYYNSIINSFIIKERHPEIGFIVAFKSLKKSKFDIKPSVVNKEIFDKTFRVDYNKEKLIFSLGLIDEYLKNGSLINLIKKVLGLIKRK
ncbi:MAG: zeta toxin family protein [Candidatus Gracilibacteria bacterium]|nr:zeta toxin family protein [Candidatus Gracilibacteria bacterium]MDD2908568.1 zeta toxin family protein [Candidatus Gracilibacteria bacterium]